MHVQHYINGYFFKILLFVHLDPQISISKAKMEKIEMVEKYFFDNNIVQIMEIFFVIELNICHTNAMHYNDDTKYLFCLDYV